MAAFTDNAAAKIKTATLIVLGESLDQTGSPGRRNSYSDKFLWAKITSSRNEGDDMSPLWQYEWTQQIDGQGGGDMASPPGTSGTFDDDTYAVPATIGSPVVVATNTVVLLRRDITTGSLPLYTFVLCNFPGVIPVQVTQDGGANGDASTAATYTYTVKNLDASITIGTEVVLTRPRPKGEMTYQSADTNYGTGFYDSTGTFLLWDAGEIPTTDSCPSE